MKNPENKTDKLSKVINVTAVGTGNAVFVGVLMWGLLQVVDS